MCRAFSCIATRTKVYWKVGLDSHEELKKQFKLNDDTVGKLVPIEITPDEGYLHPEGSWTLKFDNRSELPPDWWKSSHEKRCWDGFKQWKRIIYKSGFHKYVLEFIKELKTAKYWLKPDGKPKKDWKLFTGKTWYAASDAARYAAWDAARYAASDAAWAAARAAARAAASDAASDAARAAASDAARDTARDAALFGRMLCCIDLNIDQKHLDYCNRMMEVWRKGYALLCDVDSVLYVYAKA